MKILREWTLVVVIRMRLILKTSDNESDEEITYIKK